MANEPETRLGSRLVKAFPEGEEIVSLDYFDKRLIVATNRGVYQQGSDGIFRPLEFVVPKEGISVQPEHLRSGGIQFFDKPE